MIEMLKDKKNSRDLIWEYMLKTSDANNEFRNIEVNYATLLK